MIITNLKLKLMNLNKKNKNVSNIKKKFTKYR